MESVFPLGGLTNSWHNRRPPGLGGLRDLFFPD